MAILEDPEETVGLRRHTLRALDRIGAPFGSWWRVRRVRKALEHKATIFDPPRRPEPAYQVIPPSPPPPNVPDELALCRREAGLAPLPAPADARAANGDHNFGNCVRQRLCGPDQKTYDATLLRCCASYGASPPWFCRPGTPR